VSTLPRWARAVQKAILAKPGLTELPRCGACQRLFAPIDIKGDLCIQCDGERGQAFDDAFGSDKPFMLWDDSE
jgi:hypothetical protein